MDRSRFLLLFLLTLLSFQAEGILILGRVVAVEDGDTVLVAMPAGEVRVQLSGVDAPEAEVNPKFKVDVGRTGLAAEALLPLGRAATAHLKSLLPKGREVIFSGDPEIRDKYGRLPGELITRDGRSVNIAMVSAGFARVLESPSVPPDLMEQLKKAWERAEHQKLGLWRSHATVFRAWAGIR